MQNWRFSSFEICSLHQYNRYHAGAATVCKLRHAQFLANVLIAHKAYLVHTSNFSRRSYLYSRQSNRTGVRCRCIVHCHK